MQNNESGCLILVLDPQRSSGDLEQDARAVFGMMYQGWNYQKSGELREVLSKGCTVQGLDYCMLEATMSATGPDGRYLLEEGAALVIKADASIVIVGARHNGSMLAHGACLQRDGWPRFFASLTVNGVTAPKRTDEDPAKRITGRWVTSGSAGSGEYVFAANGGYQLIGALGTSSTASGHDYDVITTTTTAFQAVGSYDISGNELTLRSQGTGEAERVLFRFEQVNRGGTGWTERLYLLKTDGHGEYEVAYDRH
jgi:hypothetical protein